MPYAQAVGSIMQGAADIGQVVYNIINSIYQMEATERARRQAYQLAMTTRTDTLTQNRIQNQLSQDKLNLDKLGLSWDRVKFNKTFGLTKQQYLDQKAAGERAEKRAVNQNAVNQLVSMYGLQGQTQNQLLSQIGA